MQNLYQVLSSHQTPMLFRYSEVIATSENMQINHELCSLICEQKLYDMKQLAKIV